MNSTGYIQDLPDSRDRALESNLHIFGSTPPPDEFHDMAEVYDLILKQHAESCVGYSVSEAVIASWLVQGIVSPELPSPLFIWGNAKRTHGAAKLNSGTYIREAFKQMKLLGFCPDKICPGTNMRDLANFAEQPSRAAYKYAIDQKMTDLEFYRVTGGGDVRIDSWKKAISSRNPIVFGVPIVDSFFKWSGRGYIESPSVNATMAGGHAMCALGYDSNGVYGPQSWGRDWGRRGWFYMTWEYIARWGMDQWAIRAPEYFSEVKSLSEIK